MRGAFGIIASVGAPALVSPQPDLHGPGRARFAMRAADLDPSRSPRAPPTIHLPHLDQSNEIRPAPAHPLGAALGLRLQDFGEAVGVRAFRPGPVGKQGAGVSRDHPAGPGQGLSSHAGRQGAISIRRGHWQDQGEDRPPSAPARGSRCLFCTIPARTPSRPRLRPKPARTSWPAATLP